MSSISVPLVATDESAPAISRAKRAIDIVLGSIALIAVSPLLVVLAIWIVIDAGWPPLFIQERVGLRGRRFRVWKLRTMVREADLLRAGFADWNEAAFPAFKVTDDPRITRSGRILRRASLDELPQLWNVVRGEMSLVGPRPPLPSEVDHYDSRALGRLDTRPGLTCLWQVEHRHRGELSWNDWVELDLRYIDEWSFRGDLALMLRTIPAVLRMTGT